jgi:hypothetical protein
MQRTPTQLVAQSLAGVALVDSVFIALELESHDTHSHGLILVSTILILIGFFLFVNSENELKNGIAAERWSDEEAGQVAHQGSVVPCSFYRHTPRCRLRDGHQPCSRLTQLHQLHLRAPVCRGPFPHE